MLTPTKSKHKDKNKTYLTNGNICIDNLLVTLEYLGVLSEKAKSEITHVCLGVLHYDLNKDAIVGIIDNLMGALAATTIFTKEFLAMIDFNLRQGVIIERSKAERNK